MDVWAITNQKGGVGKSAVSLHLAHALGVTGARVLLVDADPQGTSTATTDSDPGDAPSMCEVLAATSTLAAVITPAAMWKFDVAPAVLGMARLEQVSALGSEFRLAEALGTVVGSYDVTIIDMPPSLGRLTLTGLVAATRALIVTEPSAPALRGVSDLLDTIDVVTSRYAPGLQLAGVIVNRVTATREASVRIDELRAVFGEQVWEPVIPQRTAVTEAMGAHVPVSTLPGDGARAAAEAFAALAARLQASKQTSKRGV
jgi:chromosome partitioning protein